MDTNSSPYKKQVADDSDEIAELPNLRFSSNIFYHSFILKKLPPNCKHILDVGCGKGMLCKKLAPYSKKITGIDLSQNMIKKAQEARSEFNNIEFLKTDYFQLKIPPNSLDAIVSVATVHHMDMERFLQKAKTELKPNGRLLLVDLYEQEHWFEKLMLPVAMGLSIFFNIIFNKRIRGSKKERDYWKQHGQSDHYLTIRELKKISNRFLPGAIIKRKLFWRYTLFWEKT